MSVEISRRGRLAGVDYGTRRIGLAICDEARSIASPAEVIESTGSPRRDAVRVMRWALEHEAVGIVVGLPLNMDGTDSNQTRTTRAFARLLSDAGVRSDAACAAERDMPVLFQDERLSSFEADEQMRGMGFTREKKHARRDALAAATILRAYLKSLQSKDP